MRSTTFRDNKVTRKFFDRFSQAGSGGVTSHNALLDRDTNAHPTGAVYIPNMEELGIPNTYPVTEQTQRITLGKYLEKYIGPGVFSGFDLTFNGSVFTVATGTAIVGTYEDELDEQLVAIRYETTTLAALPANGNYLFYLESNGGGSYVLRAVEVSIAFPLTGSQTKDIGMNVLLYLVSYYGDGYSVFDLRYGKDEKLIRPEINDMRAAQVSYVSGLSTTDEGGRTFAVNSGVVRIGDIQVNYGGGAVPSTFKLWYGVPGNWTGTVSGTVLNNNHKFQGGSYVTFSETNVYVAYFIFVAYQVVHVVQEVGVFNELKEVPLSPTALPPSLTGASPFKLVARAIIKGQASEFEMLTAAIGGSGGGASILRHNQFPDLQGGSEEERYHLTSEKASSVKKNTYDNDSPGAGSDSTQGYEVGSWFIHSTTKYMWRCFDATPGAAKWKLMNLGVVEEFRSDRPYGYKEREVVLSGGVLYVSQQDQAEGAVGSLSDPAYWKPSTARLATYDENAIAYNKVGDMLVHNGVIWKLVNASGMSYPPSIGANWIPLGHKCSAYDSTVTIYKSGDIVSSGGKLWTLLVDNPTGAPSYSNDEWVDYLAESTNSVSVGSLLSITYGFVSQEVIPEDGLNHSVSIASCRLSIDTLVTFTNTKDICIYKWVVSDFVFSERFSVASMVSDMVVLKEIVGLDTDTLLLAYITATGVKHAKINITSKIKMW